MSSMLKKTGGLAFKPKALGRRGAPASSASSQAPTAPASSTTTRDPTTEPQQTTPAEVPTLTPPSTNTASQDASATQNKKQKEKAPSAARPPSPKPTQTAEPAVGPQVAASSAAKVGGRLRQSAAASTPKPVTVAEQATTATPASEPTAPNSRPSDPTSARDEVGTTTSATLASNGPVSDSSRLSANSTPADTQTEAASAAPTTQPKKKRSYTRRKLQTTGEGGPETAADGASAPRQRTSTTTRKRVTKARASTGTEITPEADGDANTETTRPSKRRRRSATPDDAVNIKVDHTAVKMGELTRDLGIGVPFKHAEAIAERAREARNRARLRKLEKDKIRMGLLPDPGEDIHGTKRRESEAPKSRMGSSAPDNGDSQAPDTAGPGYIVVDGQIVINQQSLMIDQHASENDISRMRTVEEDDFTHLTTSASFMRESRVMGANSWTEDETEKFYNYLQMFGTDFETISHMFPGKNRRMIKLKFNREERLRPNRINAAVMVRAGKDVNIDLNHYKEKRSNWQEAEEIMQEHQALIEDHNVEIQRLKAERRAQGLADDDDDADAALQIGKTTDGSTEAGEGVTENRADDEVQQEPTGGVQEEATEREDAPIGGATLIANEVAAVG